MRVGGTPATKPATVVDAGAAIVVTVEPAAASYVSRGAHKLAGALDALGPDGPVVAGRDCLDAGASTGGFTDVLLRRGARSVVAVDVGYGQLAWSLQRDPRVIVVDRTNVRDLRPEQLPVVPQVVVADLSFISLRLVLPALIAAAAPQADLLVMVKPQFEVGRELLGAGGVVRDRGLRVAAVRRIADEAWALGLGTAATTASPLPGPRGNVEYFLWLRAGAPPPREADIVRAVEEGPA